MTFVTKSLFVMCIPFLAFGCGKKGDDASGAKGPKLAASCDLRGVAGRKFLTCDEYYGSNWNLSEVKDVCSGEEKLIEGPCPSEGIVFSCKMFAGKPSELINHYYDQADKAKATCERLNGEPL